MTAGSSKAEASGTGIEHITDPRLKYGESVFDFGMLVVVIQVRLAAVRGDCRRAVQADK
jgi:hypothetical protein